jgi:uncharacterized repeat protein (TIGR01451 family)
MKESRWSFAESRRRRAPLALLLCVTLSGILPFATPGVARAAAPGVDGALTVSAAGTVVNLYTQLVSASGRTVVVSSISQLENAALGNVGPGSVLLLYQATGATINTSNASPAPATYGGGVYGTVTAAGGAGNYEFVTVASVSGNTITLASSCATLLHAYTSSAQVVRVPQYSSVTVAAGGSITGLAWNGATGGVIAMNVSGALTLNNTSGSIVATGIGFRGATGYANAGTSSNSTYIGTVFNYVFSGETGDNLSTALGGVKGEGVAGGGSDYGTIYDTNDVSRYGRGAPANGGGGGDGHNSGGGGGANYGASGAAWYGAGLEDTAYDAYYSNANAENPSRAADPGYNGMIASANAKGGGRGGYSFGYSGAFYPNGDDGRRPVGGLGGHPLTSSAAPATSVAYMGGGGGSGDSNGGDTQNGYSFTSSGGNGGGLVLINVGTSGTTGSISGSGTIVSQGAAGNGSSEDGAGGGGAGGSVVVVLGSSGTGKVAGINVAGGAGGTETNPSGNEEAEGPGGGGQGGYISAPVTTATITGGVEGTTPQAPLSVTSMGASNTGASPGFLAYGATQGTTGYSDTAQTTIANACQSPVLGAVKSSTVVSNGDRSYTATYTVLLQNYGDSALGSVTASDVLSTTFPSPATYSIAAAPTVSATSGGATATASTTYDGYSSAANELLITTGTMPIGSTITITFKVKFLPNANGSLTYNNQVTANASGTSGTANGIATSYLSNDGNSPCATTASPEDGYGTTTCGNAVTPVTVIGEPTIQKTVQNLTTGEASGLTADTAKPGNTLQYTLSFTNTTGGTLTGVSFKDSVPANTTYVSSACGSLATGITACSATYTPPVVGPPAVAGYVTWTLTGTMANAATQTVTMNVTVN